MSLSGNVTLAHRPHSKENFLGANENFVRFSQTIQNLIWIIYTESVKVLITALIIRFYRKRRFILIVNILYIWFSSIVVTCSYHQIPRVGGVGRDWEYKWPGRRNGLFKLVFQSWSHDARFQCTKLNIVIIITINTTIVVFNNPMTGKRRRLYLSTASYHDNL